MNHRWGEKIKGTIKIKEHDIYNIKKCIHCGLRKGSMKKWWGSSLIVYFDENNNLLSTSTLPYSCLNEQIQSFKFTKNDFML